MIDIEALLRRIDELQQGPQPWTDPMITIKAGDDEKLWVQLTRDCVNAAYPRIEDPAEATRGLPGALPSGLPVIDWKPNKFATFNSADRPQAEVAAFTAAYLRQILGKQMNDPSLEVEEVDLE